MDSNIIILILFIVFCLSSGITCIVLYMNSKKADTKEEVDKTEAGKAKTDKAEADKAEEDLPEEETPEEETPEEETPETTKAADKVKTDKEKCEDERATYRVGKETWLPKGGEWDQYIKWGIAKGEVWNGPGCPVLFPGAEQAVKNQIEADKVKAASKAISDTAAAKAISDAAAKASYDAAAAKAISDAAAAKAISDAAAKIKAVKDALVAKCNAEQDIYRKDNPGSNWDNYIKYGIQIGQTWNGPSCPELYPGVEQTEKDRVKAVLITGCDAEKTAYKGINTWLTSDAWDHYINNGQFENRTWTGNNCNTLYPNAVKNARDALVKGCNEEKTTYKTNNMWLTSDSWDHYTQYGQFENRAWTGNNCNKLYPNDLKNAKYTPEIQNPILVSDLPYIPMSGPAGINQATSVDPTIENRPIFYEMNYG
jgi:hypothetical protein